MNNIQDLIKTLKELFAGSNAEVLHSDDALEEMVEMSVYDRLPEYMSQEELEAFAESFQQSGFDSTLFEQLPFYKELLQTILADFTFDAITV